VEAIEEWPMVEPLLDAWKDGARHNLALGLAKLLRQRARFDKKRVEHVMLRICAATGDDDAADRLAAVRDTFDKRTGDTAAVDYLGKELYEKVVARLPRRSRSRSSKARGNGEGGEAERDQGPPHAALVEEIMEAYRFACTADNEELGAYLDGVYRFPADYFVKAWAEGVYQAEDSSAMRGLVEELIAAIKRRSYVKRDLFNAPGKLCLKNGILDLEALAIAPHSPDILFTIQLPVAYDAAATCPGFLKFLGEILPDAKDRLVIQRLFGYCLEPGNRYQRAFMFVGPGANGKTTLNSILIGLLGR
jgi:hypothetical protein